VDLPYRDVLRQREFRLFISARTVSQLGNYASITVIAFAVLSIGAGAGGVGLVLGAESLAMAVLLLLGGVLGDRMSQRRLLVSADLSRFLTQGLTAALVLAGVARLWELVILQFLSGAASGIVVSSIYAISQETVPERLRKDNNALQSLVLSVCTVVGPGLGALVTAVSSPGGALAADACSFLVSAALLSRLRVGGERGEAGENAFANMRQGWHEFRRRRWLWSVTVLCGVSVLVVYAPMMAPGPVVARHWLGGVNAWAAIVAAMGIGGIVAGIVAVRIHPAKPLAWVVWGSISWLPVLPLLAFHAPVWSIAAAAALFGFDTAMYWTFWGTIVQQRVPKDVLARVNSFDSLGIYGPSPVAYFLIGPVVALLGVSGTLLTGGVILTIAVVAVGLVPEIRTFTDLDHAPSTRHSSPQPDVSNAGQDSSVA
jgi:MFS family permease